MKLIKEFELETLPTNSAFLAGDDEPSESWRSLFLQCECSAFILIRFVESCETRTSDNDEFKCPFCKSYNPDAIKHGPHSYKLVSASLPEVLMTIDGYVSEGSDKEFKNGVSVLSKAVTLAIDTMQKSRDEAL